jgi:hypothetical protein
MQKKAELEQAVKHARGEAEQLQAKWRDLEAKGADGVTLFYWEGRAERAAALYNALAQQWN